MEKTQPLYLMLSRTDTHMGRIIRLFTRYEYNHVSLSLDPELRQWVSFARYAQGVPLAGGFVTESPERYLWAGAPVQVKVFRIDIPATRFRKLQLLFAMADRADSGLIYNTFGAIMTPTGCRWYVPGAYTCLEFANTVLRESHSSIRSLEDAHRDDLIFEGDLQSVAPDSGERIGPFFRRRGFWNGTKDTTWHFARLCRRVASRGRNDIISAILQ